MSDLILQNSLSVYSGYLNKLDKSFYIENPSEWANENRVIPHGGSPFPGQVNMDLLPHHVEIMDNFHPDSPIKRVTIMKSVQSALTTTIESVVGWAIRHKLHNILMIISSKNIGKLRASSAIDTMIDNSGLAGYIKPMSNRIERKSGDQAMYKEFGSHRLMITSYKSMAELKSLSWDFIVMDELTDAPRGDMKDQGDVEAIIHGRTKAMRNAKIVKLSVPESIHTCRINKNFKQGDQRYWFNQCVLCGEKQIFELKAQGRKYGLMARYEQNKEGNSIIIEDSVKYICKYCEEPFYEYQKADAMKGGEWMPTARAIDPNWRSYQISGLMSPMIFYPFRDVLSEFAETNFGKDIIKFKAYVNNTLGEVWENRTKKKSWELLDKRKNKMCKPGTVPDGGLVITGGVDVHPDRLEIQLVAWGNGMESFSFDHRVFRGDVRILNGPAWIALQDYVMNTFTICGQEMHISKVAIDTGHNPNKKRVKDFGQKAHIVYNFVALNPLFVAVRGHDNENYMLIKEIRLSGLLKKRYDVSVSSIKEDILAHIDLADGPGALHFVNYPDEFFKQFLSENYTELEPGKWGWKKIYERNETWDTWIYARAAAELMNLSSWSDLVWDEYKLAVKTP